MQVEVGAIHELPLPTIPKEKPTSVGCLLFINEIDLFCFNTAVGLETPALDAKSAYAD
jgi:hypothetical protein